MAKHTPGPWIAWDDGRTVGIESADGEPISVLEIVDHGDMADPAQIAADQRLAAAAPEMLAALKSAFQHHPSAFVLSCGLPLTAGLEAKPEIMALRAVLAAIAKAEGRA